MNAFKTPGNYYKPESKRSLFNRVKFLDKVWIPAGAILIDNTYPDSDELFICYSIHEMLSYLNDTYPRGKRNRPSFFKISIYNLSADNINPSAETTYRMSKDILCTHAYCRRLFLSWDLKEVYCEAFTIGDFGSNDYIYDYGVLYGDYPRYENSDIVASDYIRKSPYKDYYYMPDCEEYFIDGTPPEDLDLKINTARDIYCIYRVWDSEKEYAADFPCREEADGCMPVATFKKVGHAEQPADNETKSQ